MNFLDTGIFTNCCCCCCYLAEANDIVKMYPNQSSLVNISNHTDTNQLDTPYKLELVAAHYNGK